MYVCVYMCVCVCVLESNLLHFSYSGEVSCLCATISSEGGGKRCLLGMCPHRGLPPLCINVCINVCMCAPMYMYICMCVGVYSELFVCVCDFIRR